MMRESSAEQTPALTRPATIVEIHKTDPANFPRENTLRLRGEREFCDAETWKQFAEAHLPRYDLPAWKIPATPELLATWIDRLDMVTSEFLAIGAYRSLSDAIGLNPVWPLRAWIGLMLEIASEERQRARAGPPKENPPKDGGSTRKTKCHRMDVAHDATRCASRKDT